eukprot:UN12039
MFISQIARNNVITILRKEPIVKQPNCLLARFRNSLVDFKG